jgi:hypothetical protein
MSPLNKKIPAKAVSTSRIPNDHFIIFNSAPLKHLSIGSLARSAGVFAR